MESTREQDGEVSRFVEESVILKQKQNSGLKSIRIQSSHSKFRIQILLRQNQTESLIFSLRIRPPMRKRQNGFLRGTNVPLG